MRALTLRQTGFLALAVVGGCFLAKLFNGVARMAVISWNRMNRVGLAARSCLLLGVLHCGGAAAASCPGADAKVMADLHGRNPAAGIDTSRYRRLTDKEAQGIAEGGTLLCVLHDRLNDLRHSHSVLLYRVPGTGKHYLIYEGGFSGTERLGFGPVGSRHE
jgi:hypothetical protein